MYRIKYIFHIMVKTYIIWICLHYLSAQLYIYFCSPYTFIGFFSSPFLVLSPQCKSLYWIFKYSRNNIDDMWNVFITWILFKINNNFR